MSGTEDKQKEYTVVPNWCNCHPETCCCNPWKLLDLEGRKLCTIYHKDDAEHLRLLLEKGRLLEMYVKVLEEKLKN